MYMQCDFDRVNSKAVVGYYVHSLIGSPAMSLCRYAQEGLEGLAKQTSCLHPLEEHKLVFKPLQFVQCLQLDVMSARHQ
eukprot:1162086-Pelagomonas_calceolata.AAC.3